LEAVALSGSRRGEQMKPIQLKVIRLLGLLVSVGCATVGESDARDRTVLPLPEPEYSPITAPEPWVAGKATIRYEFAYEGDNEFTGKIEKVKVELK
jgi:hypothetical protein